MEAAIIAPGCSGATYALSYYENFLSDRKTLHKTSNQNRQWIFRPRVHCEFATIYWNRIVLEKMLFYWVMRLWMMCKTGLSKV